MIRNKQLENIKPKGTNRNLSNHLSFFVENKNVQLQLFTNPNKQCSCDVQHQQKIGYTKFIYDNKENMVFDKPKPNVSENNSHLQQIKYNNRQTEPFGDNQKLLFPTKNLSIHSRNTEILS
jgi:hypothetical protein